MEARTCSEFMGRGVRIWARFSPAPLPAMWECFWSHSAPRPSSDSSLLLARSSFQNYWPPGCFITLLHEANSQLFRETSPLSPQLECKVSISFLSKRMQHLFWLLMISVYSCDFFLLICSGGGSVAHLLASPLKCPFRVILQAAIAARTLLAATRRIIGAKGKLDRFEEYDSSRASKKSCRFYRVWGRVIFCLGLPFFFLFCSFFLGGGPHHLTRCTSQLMSMAPSCTSFGKRLASKSKPRLQS